MRPLKPFKTLLILSILFCGCAGPQIKGPHVQVCFVQELRGGIECAMKDNTQVFLRWDQIKEKFLSGFNRNVLLTNDGFMELLEWGKRK